MIVLIRPSMRSTSLLGFLPCLIIGRTCHRLASDIAHLSPDFTPSPLYYRDITLGGLLSQWHLWHCTFVPPHRNGCWVNSWKPFCTVAVSNNLTMKENDCGSTKIHLNTLKLNESPSQLPLNYNVSPYQFSLN